ncbi:N-acetylmuramic acid 6-phosphate etherase [Anaerovirgula multivorans]|uniref:N-acetylmuramic acid 6-phosphate etherase n=1 Tax=Anaerovirgula multivorans TaxID=312168 RepID=A0A239FN07_9FIRM|nr:N-acetylmuramic acid 6-phosphate etherase [Anaerovirgula multivorans]SNS58227.1 N-acetylmuramic acid 6-phosphate etherase [Anaerovirgula multivorans]
MQINLNGMTTEERNENSKNIDSMSTLEMMQIINNEDRQVALAVEEELINIATAVDLIAEQLQKGGRLIYIGAGTSGRIGILDASECPPTYGTDPSLVQGLIAGGTEAIFKAIEGVEDNEDEGRLDLERISFNHKDVLVGIAASGRTPYVIGAMKYANTLRAQTISVTCNIGSDMSKLATIAINPIVGPEVVTGSTRMKAGTAQKMVLNMLSTGAMIKLGKVYENLMVDVEATNLKLIERCKRIVMEATGVSRETTEKYLKETDYDVKLAIFLILSKIPLIEEAREILEKNHGYVRKALESVRKSSFGSFKG